MALGDKTRKTETVEDISPESGLEKTVAISIHATGEGVDKIDWMDWFLRANDEETPFITTHAEIKVYYTEKKDK